MLSITGISGVWIRGWQQYASFLPMGSVTQEKTHIAVKGVILPQSLCCLDFFAILGTLSGVKMIHGRQ